LSGIGPAKTLEEFGIPVLADLPVGKDAHVYPFFLFFCCRLIPECMIA
jgi:hypothetical protein